MKKAIATKPGKPTKYKDLTAQEESDFLDSQISVSDLRDVLKKSIQAEAAVRIDKEYPEWKQRNMMAEVFEIHNKEIVAMKTLPLVQYTITASEKQAIIDADTCKQFIQGIRTKSNQLEASLNSMTLAELEAFNPTDDSNWS